MQERNYKTILYFITAVIISTLAIQVYWNYKNYQIGKQQLVNDVQASLDDAVSVYYEQKAAKNTMGFLTNGNRPEDFFTSDRFKNFTERTAKGVDAVSSIIIKDSMLSGDYVTIEGATSQEIDSILQSKTIHSISKRRFSDSLKNKRLFTSKDIRNSNIDSVLNRFQKNKVTDTVYALRPFSTKDSIRSKAISDLTTKIVLSFSDDTVDIPLIDSLFSNELIRKNIRTPYHIAFRDTSQTDSIIPLTDDLIVTSTSLLLPKKIF